MVVIWNTLSYANLYCLPHTSYTSWGIDDVFVILEVIVKHVRSTYPMIVRSRIPVIKGAIGLRAIKCVECNTMHIVSETWIEIDKPNYTMISIKSQQPLLKSALFMNKLMFSSTAACLTNPRTFIPPSFFSHSS